MQKIHKLNTTQKSKQHKIQQKSDKNYPVSVAFYDTRPGNEME